MKRQTGRAILEEILEKKEEKMEIRQNSAVSLLIIELTSSKTGGQPRFANLVYVTEGQNDYAEQL